MKRFFSLLGGGLLVLGVVLSGCLKNNDDVDDNTPVAGVMAFNLANDVSSATITLSGNTLTQSPLTYGSYTGSYLGVYAGVRPVEAFNSSGSSLGAPTSATFDAEKYYSLFLVGANNTYRNIVVHDDFDTLVVTDQAYIRYINAIPDSSHPTVTIASNGSNVVNDNAGFSTVSEFKAVNAGDVAINVTNGGNINVNRTINLEQRKVYTVLISGTPGGTGDNAVQIKFIVNGLLTEENAARIGSSAARSAN